MTSLSQAMVKQYTPPITLNLPNIEATWQLRDDDDEQIAFNNIVDHEAENAEILEECNYHWE